MLRKSLRKILNHTNEEEATLRMPFANPIGNHAHKKTTIAAICVVTAVIFGTIILELGSSITVAYAGSVEGLGVGIYWDQACLNRTLSFDWGPVGIGSRNTFTVYIRNEGNSAVSLSLSTSKWTPSSSSDYISLNWNYSGQTLNANQVIPLELTLTIDPAVTGIAGFTFGTTITTTSK